MMNNNYLTTAIIAHVDAGKTTLSEGILYKTGITRTLGRVDHGDAFFDTHNLERKRGITIFSKQAVFPLDNKKVNLLDTPGHMDFSAEMERTLSVLDYAILVISASDGVTGQVDTLWKLLQKYQVPTFVFINKMDQPGCNLDAVMKSLRTSLSDSFVLFDKEDDDFYENVAACDEQLLEDFFDTGVLSDQAIAGSIQALKVTPCYSGSALKMIGLDNLLDGFSRFTICNTYPDKFGAKVFKITRDDKGNRLTHMKITGGKLRVKETIGEEKINQIRIYNGAKSDAVAEAEAGQVVSVTGLDNTYSGQGLGFEEGIEKPIMDAVMSYEVVLPDGSDVHEAHVKLRQLSEEIPELHVAWNEENGSIRMNLMGEIQAEIIKSIVSDRYGFTIDYSQGKVMYRETIKGKTYGVGHYEPLKHYAEVHLIMEALPEGSGLVFDSICSEDVLDRNWQRLIMTHLAEREHPGVLTGSPITDMKISIATGKAHIKHTEGGDFRQATYRAIRQGLRRAENVLLEPYYSYILEVPTDMVGRAMSDIQRLSGTCTPGETATSDLAVLTGICPVATMNGYERDVISYTRGQGRLSCIFNGYKPCHNTEEVLDETAYDADTDAENPTGSIFCSHGGGTFIPWDEVEKYMHLDMVLREKEMPDAVSGQIRPQRQREYSHAELDAVFQMTYGVNKRNQNSFKRGPRTIEAASQTGPKVQSGYNKSGAKEVLVIDGYNIIFAWEELKELSSLNLEAARDKLIEILRNYHGFTGTDMILVFDAYKQKGSTQHNESYDGLNIVYTKENETADRYIETYVTENAKKYKITVATSDGLEQTMIFGQGALRMPARELKERIADAERSIRNLLKNTQ